MAKQSDKIPPAEIDRICRSLWGEKWRSLAPSIFGVHRQTVYEWMRTGAPRESFAQSLATYLLRVRRAMDDVETLILEWTAKN